ncbi:MAG: TatD family hydrolase, partial [Patescibacteria group bacterium]
QFQAYKDDRNAVIDRCRKKGMMCHIVGTQKDTSKAAVELAEKLDFGFASIGTHPNHLFPTHIDEEETHFMSREEDFDEAYYDGLAMSPKVVAVGECGLDLFHLPPDVPVETVLAKQIDVFKKHVAFANKHNLPMVIHVREAHEHLLKLLMSLPQATPCLANDPSLPSPDRGGELCRPRATIHCFTSNWTNAEQYLAMGFYLGFTGVITFPPLKKNPQAHHDLLDVVKRMPLDRMLLETDSPYMAPIPHRGERAEPWMTEEVVKKIAELRGISSKIVEEQTMRNALTLFDRMK